MATIIFYLIYKITMSIMYGTCSKFTGMEFKNCRIKMMNETIENLYKNIDKCKFSKNEEVCKEKLNKMISKLTKEKDEIYI